MIDIEFKLKLFLYIFQADHNSIPIELIRTINLVIWTVVTACAFGEVGEMVKNEFINFNDALDQCNWFHFPKQVQHMFVILIANSQQPTLIRGYGNRLCARDTFKRVNFKRYSKSLVDDILKYFFLFVLILFVDYSNGILLLCNYASS